MKKREFIIKRMVSSFLVGALILGTFPATQIKATNNEIGKEINTVRKLENSINKSRKDGKISKAEKENIIKETELDVIDKYIAKKTDEIKDVINSTDGNGGNLIHSEYDAESDTYTEIIEYEIDDTLTVTTTIQDKSNNNLNFAGSTLLFYGGVNVAVGESRITECTYSIKVLGWAVNTFKLKLYYNVNSKSLKATNSSTSGSSSALNLSASSTILTSTASSKGSSISCKGTYTINGPGFVGAVYEIKIVTKWNTSTANGNPSRIRYDIYLL